MLNRYLQWIGIDGIFLENADQTELALQYPNVLLIGLPLLLPIAIFVYLRHRRNLLSAPPLLRATLTVTRVLVLLLLIGVLASPFVRLDLVKEKKAIVGVLLDQSQSMLELDYGVLPDNEARQLAEAAGYRVPDGPLEAEMRKSLPKTSRAKMAQLVLKTQRKEFLEPLGKNFDFQFLTFSKEVALLGIDPASGDIPDPTPPGGSSTHIGSAVSHILSQAGGRQVAGIFVFSDGENTGGTTPAEVAAASRGMGTPIYTIPVGSPRRFRDVAIVDVSTSGQVAVGDMAKVGVVIESQEYDGKSVKVTVKDGPKLLDTKEIILHNAEQQQVELIFKAETAGLRYLDVEVTPFADEELKNNNSDTALLKVGDDRLKVLYLEGLPRWDFRFLKNAMKRDQGLTGRLSKVPEIIVETEWRRLPEDQQAKALPQTLEDISGYHLIILGDVSPKLLSPKLVKLLDQAVREKGVGLLIEAGPQSMPHLFDKTFLDLLPVQIDPRSAGIYSPAAKPFKLELTPEGSLHEAMRLYEDNGRNQAAWAQMLPYQWSVNAIRPKPAATVLAWNPGIQNSFGKLPLIAWHSVGEGKVMLVGTDSTWLWRQNVADRFFYRFWGQSMRFIARNEEEAAKKTRVRVFPPRVQPGEEVEVDLLAFTEAGAPVEAPEMAVEIIGDRLRTSLNLSPRSKGRYTGRFTVPASGQYRFVHTGSTSGSAESRVRAIASPEEMRYPNVNRKTLRTLAEGSGGEMIELYDTKKLQDIVGRLKSDTKSGSRHFEATIWDNWLILTILVLIYSLDVGLRRLAGLS